MEWFFKQSSFELVLQQGICELSSMDGLGATIRLRWCRSEELISVCSGDKREFKNSIHLQMLSGCSTLSHTAGRVVHTFEINWNCFIFDLKGAELSQNLLKSSIPANPAVIKQVRPCSLDR